MKFDYKTYCNSLESENERLNIIIDELEEKINKAIEHIKKYQYWNGDNYNCLHCEELLEILGADEE